jgi:hypothetical protein
MPEISKKEKQIDWACRILITVDLLIVLAGYFSFLQAKWQLASPLIPKETINQILSDGTDVIMKASIIAGSIFLPGIWLYTFKRKKLALVLFIVAPIIYKLLLLL